MKSRPSVALIVLNWNSHAYLRRCLQSLLALDYPTPELIVVDNASGDESCRLVRAEFPTVKLIASERNLGYAGGNNLGLQATSAEICVILNPDVEVPPTWLDALVRTVDSDPAIGVAGALLTFADGRTIQHAGGRVEPPLAWTRHIGAHAADPAAYAAVTDVDYVIGAAMAIRRTTLDRIGGFDETFFLYYEDVDYCVRARAAGFRVVYAPTPPAVHHESVTTGKESDFYLAHLHAGRWRFLVKHLPVAALEEQTFPAERGWLAERSPRERLALVRAYRMVLADLPQLRTPRGLEGETSMNATDRENQKLAEYLTSLIDEAAAAHTLSYARADAALSPEAQQALAETEKRLHAASYVTEQPLVSHAPVVGGLITWFRNAWNNIATTWYVRPLLQQQNDYNALLYQRLEELTAFQREIYAIVKETHLLLEGLDARLRDDDRDLTDLTRRVGELTVALRRLDDRHAPNRDAAG